MYRENGEKEHSVLVIGLNGHVIGMHVTTGKILWEHSIGRGDVELLIQDDRVYASDGRNVYAFRYPDGAELFAVGIPGNYLGRPTMLLEGPRLFVATRGEVTCLSLDGAVLWHDGLPGRGCGSLALGVPGNVRQADDIGSQ